MRALTITEQPASIYDLIIWIYWIKNITYSINIMLFHHSTFFLCSPLILNVHIKRTHKFIQSLSIINIPQFAACNDILSVAQMNAFIRTIERFMNFKCIDARLCQICVRVWSNWICPYDVVHVLLIQCDKWTSFGMALADCVAVSNLQSADA